MADAGTRLSPSGVCAAFVRIVGRQRWAARMAELSNRSRAGQRSGRALLQRHAIEIAIDRQARGMAPATRPETIVTELAGEVVATHAHLGREGQARVKARLIEALTGEACLAPFLHVFRTAALQQARGFTVHYAGLADAAPFDLLINRDGVEAEIACDTVSAEEGRDVHRGAWTDLVDRIDPDLQTWLAAHPGRYVLKLTLPQGLRAEPANLAQLHARIRAMLAGQRRADQDEAAVLRLDPLMLAASQMEEAIPPTQGLIGSLRQAYGAQANLAVTTSGSAVFVLAARAGRADEVAAAIRRRLAAIAPSRLTGARPGILAIFVEDTDRAEWRDLRDRLELEGEARQFLANPQARSVIAVTCTSRMELLGAPTPDAAPDGEMRFRNPAHPAARHPALAPAILSSI